MKTHHKIILGDARCMKEGGSLLILAGTVSRSHRGAAADHRNRGKCPDEERSQVAPYRLPQHTPRLAERQDSPFRGITEWPETGYSDPNSASKNT